MGFGSDYVTPDLPSVFSIGGDFTYAQKWGLENLSQTPSESEKVGPGLFGLHLVV